MSDRIEPGFYKGRAIAGSEQYATKNDKDQIALDLDIPALGRALTTFLYFSEAAAPYAVERLRACGWQGDDVSKLVGIDQNEIDVQIKYGFHEGKEQMKVDIATGGGGRIKLENTMDERAKRAFAARMKPLLAGSAITPARQQAPAARAPAPKREGAFDPGPPDNDDIPF